MTKKSLQEIMEENKKILIAEFQKGFLAGFQDAENRIIPEFLSDLKAIKNYEIELLIVEDKWEERVK